MLKIKYYLQQHDVDDAIEFTRDLLSTNYYDFWVYEYGADKINGRKTSKDPDEVFLEMTHRASDIVFESLSNGKLDVNKDFWVITPSGDEVLSTNKIYDLLVDFITEAIEELYLTEEEVEEALGL